MPFRDSIWKHIMWSFQFTVLSLPMKNMVPFNSTDHSISQCYAWACRGTTIKVGKMQLQTIPNMYLSVESLAMIKGPVNSFLQERKVFLQRHQISLCHDKVPALLAKRLREGRGCFGPWKCMKEQQRKKLLTSLRVQASVFSFSLKAVFVTLVYCAGCNSYKSVRNLCTYLPQISISLYDIEQGSQIKRG